jgi:predicted DNA-binding transcriptional regulator AlpA
MEINTMDESLLTIKKVSDKISFSKSYIYAMIKDEDFPKPKKWEKYFLYLVYWLRSSSQSDQCCIIFFLYSSLVALL